jgi:hypothetical protein
MKAAVMEVIRAPLKVYSNWPDPECGPSDAVIRVEANGICRSDYHIWRGGWEWLGFVPQPATVVGVVPKGFRGLYSFTEMDGYLPLSMMATSAQWTDRSQRWLTVLGRLRAGVSLSQAQSSINVISERLAKQCPVTDKSITVRVLPERLARLRSRSYLECDHGSAPDRLRPAAYKGILPRD